MRLTHSTMFLAALWLVSTSLAAALTGLAGPAGHWEGIIHMGAQEVPVAVDLAHGAATPGSAR